MNTTSPYKTLVVALFSAAAAGCTMVGPNFQRPDSPDVQRYTSEKLKIESSGAAAGGTPEQQVVAGLPIQNEWWKEFHSDAFDALVQRALAGNRNLAAAAATLAQAQELANAQAGTLGPQAGLTSAVGRQKLGAESLGSFDLPPFTYFAIGPTVSYTLDYTGSAHRSLEQTQAVAQYRQHQAEAAALSVTGNTLMQALRIASLQAQIATIEGLLERDRENLRLVQVAFDAGSVARLDIVSAQSQLAADLTLLPTLRQQQGVARHALAILMGSAPANAAIPELNLDKLELPMRLPLSVPSELASHRPDILAAEAQLHASTAAVGVAEGNLYPHISISASVGQQAGEFGHLFDRAGSVFGLSAGLVAPLFDGGTLRAEHRAAIDAMHASASNYEQTVLEAFGQVADSLQALEHGAEELQARAQALDAARQSVELTRRSYAEGNVGILQVLDAERRFQQASLGYVQAQGQRFMDTVQLYLALGGAGPVPQG